MSRVQHARMRRDGRRVACWTAASQDRTPAVHKLRSVSSPMPGMWQNVFVNMAKPSLLGLADGAGRPKLALAALPRLGRACRLPRVHTGEVAQRVLCMGGAYLFLVGF